jgi:hypothetical protein
VGSTHNAKNLIHLPPPYLSRDSSIVVSPSRDQATQARQDDFVAHLRVAGYGGRADGGGGVEGVLGDLRGRHFLGLLLLWRAVWIAGKCDVCEDWRWEVE